VDFLGGTLFALPAHATLVRQQVGAAHLDALAYIASNAHDPDNAQPFADAAFAEGFRRLAHHLLTTPYLSPQLQEHLFHAILVHTPLPPLECVHVLARLLVSRHAHGSEVAEGDPLALRLWEGVFTTLFAAHDGGVGREKGVSLEFMEVLLLAFHLLKAQGRAKVLRGVLAALSTLSAASSMPSAKKRAQDEVAIAALALALNCILFTDLLIAH
jgi:hypothetical protein